MDSPMGFAAHNCILGHHGTKIASQLILIPTYPYQIWYFDVIFFVCFDPSQFYPVTFFVTNHCEVCSLDQKRGWVEKRRPFDVHPFGI